jgi:hypothetical protein
MQNGSVARMKRPVFSSLAMISVAVSFVLGLAALARPSALVGSALFTITLGLLCTATSMGFVRDGKSRAFWVGFAAFGWPYFALAFPWSQADGVNPPLLLSGTLLLALPPFGEGFDRFTLYDLGYYLPVGQCLATIGFAFTGAILVRLVAGPVGQRSV